MKRKLLHTLAALALLLPTGGAVRAQRQEDQTLTPDERREAGEFLLRLDERWREARDFGALFDEAFVGDFAEVSREDPDALSFLELDESLRRQLSAGEWRRAHVVGLNSVYVFGRLALTFERWKKSRRAASRPAASPRADGGEPSGEGAESSADDGDGADPAYEELLSPALFAEFKRDRMLRAHLLGDGDEDLEITTHELLDELLSALEGATQKMRARLKELEADLPDAPVSAVPREDEDEGEWPDLQLTSAEAEAKNRPAGTRVVCGYVSFLQVLLVKEGGRYKVLAAYMLAD